MKQLDKWLDEYFEARPQLTPPKKNIFGEYEMDSNLRNAFEKLANEHNELYESYKLTT